MSTENLSKEQLAFLEECNLEFSERYTDSDLEYKKIYDLGIPPPPIMCPWYGKGQFHRDRRGGGRYNDYRNRNQHYRNEDNNRNQHYGYRERYNREQAGSSYNNDRYRGRDNYEDERRDFQHRDRYRPY